MASPLDAIRKMKNGEIDDNVVEFLKGVRRAEGPAIVTEETSRTQKKSQPTRTRTQDDEWAEFTGAKIGHAAEEDEFARISRDLERRRINGEFKGVGANGTVPLNNSVIDSLMSGGIRGAKNILKEEQDRENAEKRKQLEKLDSQSPVKTSASQGSVPQDLETRLTPLIEKIVYKVLLNDVMSEDRINKIVRKAMKEILLEAKSKVK